MTARQQDVVPGSGGEPEVRFRTVLRGYDPAAVEARVADLESALGRLLTRSDQIGSRPSADDATPGPAAQDRSSEPGSTLRHANLASRGRRMLQLAADEAQALGARAVAGADQLTTGAQAQAGRILAAAAVDARAVTEASTQQVADLHDSATADIQAILSAATRHAEEVLAVARREAARIISAAEHEASLARTRCDRDVARQRVAVEVDLTRRRAQAIEQADQLRADARAQAGQTRTRAAAHRDGTDQAIAQMVADVDDVLQLREQQAVQDLAERRQRVVASIRQVTAEASARVAAAEQRRARAAETAQTAVRGAVVAAEAVVAGARQRVDQHLQQARSHADKVLADAQDRARRRLLQARQHTQTLAQERDRLHAELEHFAAAVAAASTRAPVVEPGPGPVSNSYAGPTEPIGAPAPDHVTAMEARPAAAGRR